MPIDTATLAARFPRLFHMAERGSWPSIKRHGLLSTTALLDLFGVEGPERAALERAHRPESVRVEHPAHGSAVVRDQKPMSDDGLRKALRDGLTPAEWYGILNSKVFFWLTEARLNTLMSARAYRDLRHDVLVVDTAALLARHAARVVLSPMNSGATKPMPHPRGRDTFLPLAEYPFNEWDKKRGRKDPVVELAVEGGVPDIRDYVLRVDEVGGGVAPTPIWQR